MLRSSAVIARSPGHTVNPGTGSARGDRDLSGGLWRPTRRSFHVGQELASCVCRAGVPRPPAVAVRPKGRSLGQVTGTQGQTFPTTPRGRF